jgi:hypothetical protein
MVLGKLHALQSDVRRADAIIAHGHVLVAPEDLFKLGRVLQFPAAGAVGHGRLGAEDGLDGE